MERFEIYNLALSIFNMPLITEEDVGADAPKHEDVAILDAWYMSALRKASREHRWSFLEARLDLSEDLGRAQGYLHSYALPEDFFSLTYAEGRHYRVTGNTLLTDGEPIAYGYTKSIIPEGANVPEDFYECVAFALAYYASYHFNPNLRNAILQDYQVHVLGLIASELRHGRKDMEAYDAD